MESQVPLLLATELELAGFIHHAAGVSFAWKVKRIYVMGFMPLEGM